MKACKIIGCNSEYHVWRYSTNVFVASIRSKPFLSIHNTLIFTKSYIDKDTFISGIFLKAGVGLEAVICSFFNPLISFVYLL